MPPGLSVCDKCSHLNRTLLNRSEDSMRQEMHVWNVPPETGTWDWAYYRWVRLNVLAIVRNTSRSSVSNSVVVIRQRCCYNTAKYNETLYTVYPKKYAHGFCFAVLCCGYTLTDFPISIRLTSLALWQSYDCPSASKATLMNMDKYFMWIHYEWLHNHNKAKHNKTVCIFLGIYCTALW